MNIEDLTIKQAKELVALFGGTSKPCNTMIGKNCIARCHAAGVHYGTVVSVDGDTVLLRDSRRLWSWKAVEGVALSGLAQNGLDSGKIDTMNPEIWLSGVCELIPVSKKFEDSLHGK